MNCPACGEPSIPETNFCRKCGVNLLIQDAEATSAITRKMRPEVVFPNTGSQVVQLERKDAVDKTKISSSPLVSAQEKRSLPTESLAFTVDPPFFNKYFVEAFERRGLMRLRESYTLPGNIIGTDKKRYIPDQEVKEKHIELLLVRDENYVDEYDRVRDAKTKIPFYDIESAKIEGKIFKGVFLIKPVFVVRLKPERDVYRLEVDRVIREVRFNIVRKDLRIARKLQTALMYELSNANRKKVR